jgi:hypothetical protein
MAIANLPIFFDMLYSKQDGYLAPDGYLYNDQMFQSLNNLLMIFNKSASTIFTNIPALQAVGINAPALLGVNPPSFTTGQINAIVAINPYVVPFGTTWYNITINKLQVWVQVSPGPPPVGAIQTITSV